MTSITVQNTTVQAVIEDSDVQVVVTANPVSIVNVITPGPQGPKGDPGGAGVSTFSGGSTGLTPVVPINGAITLGGTLNTSHGGTGATSLNGYVKGTGVDALTAVQGIPASDISTPIDCGTFN